jgi:Protein of unknown function (DUF2752)
MSVMSHSVDNTSAPQPEQRRRRQMLVAVLALLLALFAVLYRFPPAEYSFYPRCLLHETTGLHCPGCGGTRCVYALLHGNLLQAAAYNILVLLLLPYLGLHAVNACWHALAGRPAFRWRTPVWLPKVAVVAVILFWILRNLPFAPFTLLAPHKI